LTSVQPDKPLKPPVEPEVVPEGDQSFESLFNDDSSFDVDNSDFGFEFF
jgi:hypothetical protein